MLLLTSYSILIKNGIYAIILALRLTLIASKTEKSADLKN